MAIWRDYEGFIPLNNRMLECTVLRPTRADMIESMVSDARRKKMPLTSFSSASGARRRGLSAPVDGKILDLSNLKAIHHIDPDEAVAVIEPGLTFRELDRALAPYGLRSYKPLLPRAGKSVIASYLEREPITAVRDQWDILDPFGAVEMVFGSGERFRTGGASNPGSRASHWEAGMRYLTAMGPAATDFLRVIQGAQGTLGVLTWATVMCDRIPRLQRPFLITATGPGPLSRVAAELCYRRIGHEMFLSSGRHLAQVAAHCGIGADQTSLPPWALFVNLSTAAELPEERLAWEEADLLRIVREEGLEPTKSAGGISPEAIAAALTDPIIADHASCFREGCREVFMLTQMDRVPLFQDVMEQLGRELKVDTSGVGTYVQPRLQGRNCHLEFVIPADIAAQSDFACLLARKCQATGGLFSRPYGEWAHMALAANPPIGPMLAKTKHLLDPAGIMAPGRFPY